MVHHTKVFWERRSGEQFTDLKYSRTHRWSFDGGVEIPASSSPSIVPLPYSDASSVDPEEAFTAALSSCHMLSFLSVAAARKFVVERYEDNAEYSMAKKRRRQDSSRKCHPQTGDRIQRPVNTLSGPDSRIARDGTLRMLPRKFGEIKNHYNSQEITGRVNHE